MRSGRRARAPRPTSSVLRAACAIVCATWLGKRFRFAADVADIGPAAASASRLRCLPSLEDDVVRGATGGERRGEVVHGGGARCAQGVARDGSDVLSGGLANDHW